MEFDLKDVSVLFSCKFQAKYFFFKKLENDL